MSDWPSLKEELDRKTVEAIDRLLIQEAAGEITQREMYLALGAVMDVIQGLVESDITAAISDKLASLNTSQKALFRLLANEHEGLMLLEVRPEQADVIVTRVSGAVLRGRLKGINDADSATVLSKVDELAKRQCLKEGWKEL